MKVGSSQIKQELHGVNPTYSVKPSKKPTHKINIKIIMDKI